jgi:hypothetical protein
MRLTSEPFNPEPKNHVYPVDPANNIGAALKKETLS